MQNSITAVPFVIKVMKTVIRGMAMTEAVRIFLAWAEKRPTSTLEGIMTAQKRERANFPEEEASTSEKKVSIKKAKPFSKPT